MNLPLPEDPIECVLELREHAKRLLAAAERIENRHRMRYMTRVARTLLAERLPRSEVCGMLIGRFHISRQHAYRVIGCALNEGPM